MNPNQLSNLPIDLISLSLHWNLLPATPAWSDVEKAVNQFTSPDVDDEVSEEVREQAYQLNDFLDVFRRHSSTLARTMIVAAKLGRAAGIKESGQWIRRGVAAMATLYDPVSPTDSQTDTESPQDWATIVTDVERLLSKQEVFRCKSITRDSRFTCYRHNITDWTDVVSHEINLISSTSEFNPPENFRQEAWRLWEERLHRDVDRNLEHDVELPDLLCATAFVTPATVLEMRSDRMLLRDWTRILFNALTGAGESEPALAFDFSCPVWLALPAIRELGLPARLTHVTETITSKRKKKQSERCGDADRPLQPTAFFSNVPRTKSETPDLEVALLISESDDGGLFGSYQRETSQPMSACVFSLKEFEILQANEFQSVVDLQMFSFVAVDVSNPDESNSLKRILANKEIDAFTVYKTEDFAVTDGIIAPRTLQELRDEVAVKRRPR